MPRPINRQEARRLQVQAGGKTTKTATVILATLPYLLAAQACGGVPCPTDSHLLLLVVDRNTREMIYDAKLTVQERNPPPYDECDRGYSIESSRSPGLVFFRMPPDKTTACIRVEKPGYKPSAPLVMTAEFYWKNLGKAYVLKHTFELERTARPTSQPHTPADVSRQAMRRRLESLYEQQVEIEARITWQRELLHGLVARLISLAPPDQRVQLPPDCRPTIKTFPPECSAAKRL